MTSQHLTAQHSWCYGRHERGVVLFIALIALVVMSLAGVALMRSVGAGVLLAGNVDFKRTATSLADLGVEQARTDLLALVPAAYDINAPGIGYHTTTLSFPDPVNATAAAWAANSTSLPAAALPAYAQDIRYVIHRLCTPAVGPPPATFVANATDCVSTGSGVGGSSAAGLTHGHGVLTGTSGAYFRVTSRVVLRNRNTVSFVQTVMY